MTDLGKKLLMLMGKSLQEHALSHFARHSLAH